MDISSLIPMLKANGVTKFEGYGIKLELSSGEASRISPVEPFIPLDPQTKPGIPDPTMDLPGTNDAMSYDKILNWSASPDADESPLPLTGDAPLAVE